MPAQFVEYGPLVTFPPPFLSLGGNFIGVGLQGDQATITDLVKRVLNEPAAGESGKAPVEYLVVSDLVFLMVGTFERQTSEAQKFVGRGFASETGAMFWVPLVAQPAGGSKPYGCLFAPMVIIDNPMSLLCGREDLGYAKTMAQFDPPSELASPITIRPFGGNFGLQMKAGWRPLLVLEEASPFKPADAPFAPLHAQATSIGSGWVAPRDPEALRDLPGEESPEEVAETLEARVGGVKKDQPLAPNGVGFVQKLLAGSIRQVFLKQFRDCADPTLACYQEIVETRMELVNIHAAPGPLWTVRIEHLDSHPIAQELGLPNQTTEIVFRMQADMKVSKGTVVAP
jgi:hypothetical protein